jgi:predicted DNA-binding protein with PD1-like motif
MKSKLINKSPRTWAIIFETGDEVVAGLTQFAEEQNLPAGHLTAIGAFSETTLGIFTFQELHYKTILLHEQVEVLSMTGDIVQKDGKPQLHAHVVVGRCDGTAHGGHLLSAKVRPALEIILTESPAYLKREEDKSTGLALIQI